MSSAESRGFSFLGTEKIKGLIDRLDSVIVMLSFGVTGENYLNGINFKRSLMLENETTDIILVIKLLFKPSTIVLNHSLNSIFKSARWHEKFVFSRSFNSSFLVPQRATT